MKKSIFLIILFLILGACNNRNPDNKTVSAMENKKSIAELYPPIDIREWEKTLVVNGRLPTKEETENGTSLLYYPDPGPDVKAYDMKLPKLAYYTDAKSGKKELVVVIQIVQSRQDTMVGYRPLTGLNGASVFKDFRFLTEEEITKLNKD